MDRRTLLSTLVAAATCPGASLAAQGKRVAVFGDSLADGLWMGLRGAGKDGGAPEYARLGRVSSGLVKSGFYDWQAGAEKIAAGAYACGICMVGLNDQQTIDTGGGRIPFGASAWDDAYADLVGSIVAAFARRRVPLVWVGLPTVRDRRVSDGVHEINDVVSGVVTNGGGLFVSTWELTAGPDGRYTAFIADERGRKSEMRAPDGMHMTGEGYLLLGRMVEHRMREAALTASLFG